MPRFIRWQPTNVSYKLIGFNPSLTEDDPSYVSMNPVKDAEGPLLPSMAAGLQAANIRRMVCTGLPSASKWPHDIKHGVQYWTIDGPRWMLSNACACMHATS